LSYAQQRFCQGVWSAGRADGFSKRECQNTLDEKEETHMKLALIVLSWLALMNVSTALGAPPQIEDFCFAQIEQVRPPLVQAEAV
jgi:hypothetical protein